ncbi:hypothetical protein ACHAWC_009557 [Mediolabrus comicus]
MLVLANYLCSRSQKHHLLNNAALITRRCLSSTTSRVNNPPPSNSSVDNNDIGVPQILDEQTLLTQLSPLKRILCLCPVPLGRGRISWSGGDSLATTTTSPTRDDTINFDFQTKPYSAQRDMIPNSWPPPSYDNASSPQLKVSKYRYGERFAIGVAVSDPYLTHAVPVHLNKRGRSSSNGGTNNGGFTCEIVPTFKGDMHNLNTTSPIFHTNLPYFRKDFLQHIGHTDIGAIVLALPMQAEVNPFCPMPTKLQLEEERKSLEVREYLFGLLQNYVSLDINDDDDDTKEDEEDGYQGNDNGALDESTKKKKKSQDGVPFFGPLNLQGCINRRLSVADVLSKATNSGNWDHLARDIRSIQQSSMYRRSCPSISRVSQYGVGGGSSSSSVNKWEYEDDNVVNNVSPEIHAAVALNAMLERHTSDFHNSFF